jgi:hypothetical protein
MSEPESPSYSPAGLLKSPRPENVDSKSEDRRSRDRDRSSRRSRSPKRHRSTKRTRSRSRSPPSRRSASPRRPSRRSPRDIIDRGGPSGTQPPAWSDRSTQRYVDYRAPQRGYYDPVRSSYPEPYYPCRPPYGADYSYQYPVEPYPYPPGGRPRYPRYEAAVADPWWGQELPPPPPPRSREKQPREVEMEEEDEYEEGEEEMDFPEDEEPPAKDAEETPEELARIEKAVDEELVKFEKYVLNYFLNSRSENNTIS